MSYRLALVGRPGVGKSTAGGILCTLCADSGLAFRRIKLADPLYQLQDQVYRMAGRPLSDFYRQDGELLSFLGQCLRRINQSALTDHFADTLRRAEISMEGKPYLILCDDARPLDLPKLEEMGFRIVRVSAPAEVCLHRRRNRGDVTLVEANHVIESGVADIEPNYEIDNSGDLAALRLKLEALLKAISS